MTRILIIKFGALGDVLRTTAILPGLQKKHPGARIEWVTSCAARDLVQGHPLVAKTHWTDPQDAHACTALGAELEKESWNWVISLDDESLPCELATQLAKERRSGAFLMESGQVGYTDDSAAWFDMGLISRLGKAEADRRKVANTRTHPAIYAEMLGIEFGQPQLSVPPEMLSRAKELLAPGKQGEWLIGLNTGASGRWTSKALPVERAVELAVSLHVALNGRVKFVILGGADEAERNREILVRLQRDHPSLNVIDGSTRNSLLEFAAIIDCLDLLVTSDSLALHMGVSRSVRIVAFFAPTSAAEIELYGLGRKVASQGADYCSYRPDADNATITTARLVDAVCEVIQTPSDPQS